MTAIYIPHTSHKDPFHNLYPFYKDVDFVLIEGFISGPGNKIEIWRQEVGIKPMILENTDIDAVVSNDFIQTTKPVWPRNDVSCIADNIISMIGFVKL